MARGKAIDAGWAAFNIETDGNQFDFKVALGATVVGFREPESTSILLSGLDETATCRVSIQKSSRRGHDRRVAKRLEVLSPLYGHDVELDCADECVKQLSTALRLYRSTPFSIVSLERRRVARPGLRSAESYVLRGSELRAFLEFSQRLLSFHRDRNLFRRARFLPADIEDDVREVLGGSRQHEARVLETVPHLMIASELFEKALEDWNVARELQLVLLIMAAEALFGTDDKSELAFRLSLRMAVRNGSDDPHRKELFEAVRRCYDTRSRLVHGSWYRQSKGFVRVPDLELRTLGRLVRASILYSWALSEMRKDELLQGLDRAVFDRSEIEELRAKANQYWGLKGSTEERIHSARWGAGAT